MKKQAIGSQEPWRVVGNCPECGAPIFADDRHEGDGPPPVHRTCFCVPGIRVTQPCIWPVVVPYTPVPSVPWPNITWGDTSATGFPPEGTVSIPFVQTGSPTVIRGDVMVTDPGGNRTWIGMNEMPPGTSWSWTA